MVEVNHLVGTVVLKLGWTLIGDWPLQVVNHLTVIVVLKVDCTLIGEWPLLGMNPPYMDCSILYEFQTASHLKEEY